MLSSMTAFAKADNESTFGTISWEIRCVNHRFLDPHFRIPEQFTSIENELREILKQDLSRGRCDVYLRFTPKMSTDTIQLDEIFIMQLLKQLEHIANKSKIPLQYSGVELLRLPGVIRMPAVENEALNVEILQTFKIVMQILMKDRQREGTHIQQLLQQRLAQIVQQFKAIIERIPSLLPQLHERIKNALQTIKSELNQERLEQEMVYLANKLDVQEESDRFQTHLQELSETINKGGPVGRRLDFLLQELQREINTLGNKANDKMISQRVVEIKVLIEQIREQVQNVE